MRFRPFFSFSRRSGKKLDVEISPVFANTVRGKGLDNAESAKWREKENGEVKKKEKVSGRPGWWKRRSLFQKYMLCISVVSVVTITHSIIMIREYGRPGIDRSLQPYTEFVKSIVNVDPNNGSVLYMIPFLIAIATLVTLPIVHAVAINYRTRKGIRQQYGGQYVTARGEVVKSYGEKKIADYLHARGVRYGYEWPFYGRDEHGQYRLLAHPDFTVIEDGMTIIIEYFGMANSSREYNETAAWKVERYQQNGACVIGLLPRDLNNLRGKLGI